MTVAETMTEARFQDLTLAEVTHVRGFSHHGEPPSRIQSLEMTMHNIKREVVNAIADLPETAGLDDIVAVVEKIRLAEDYVVQPTAHRASPPLSFSAAARKYSGCLPGAPADLSTNSAHFEGFGE